MNSLSKRAQFSRSTDAGPLNGLVREKLAGGGMTQTRVLALDRNGCLQTARWSVASPAHRRGTAACAPTTTSCKTPFSALNNHEVKKETA